MCYWLGSLLLLKDSYSLSLFLLSVWGHPGRAVSLQGEVWECRGGETLLQSGAAAEPRAPETSAGQRKPCECSIHVMLMFNRGTDNRDSSRGKSAYCIVFVLEIGAEKKHHLFDNALFTVCLNILYSLKVKCVILWLTTTPNWIAHCFQTGFPKYFTKIYKEKIKPSMCCDH